jgi:FixJ family two-component response regulator
VRESLEALIRCEGWQPEIFACAQEFLSRPPVAVPSCLVLDVNLPDLNGLDLQQRVGADRTDMPIIFITGHGDVPMTVQAMKAGAVEFLTKPLDDDALVSAIRHTVSTTLHLSGGGHTGVAGRLHRSAAAGRRIMALVVTGLLNKQVGYRSSASSRDHCESTEAR